jgi:hypothetical protein
MYSLPALQVFFCLYQGHFSHKVLEVLPEPEFINFSEAQDQFQEAWRNRLLEINSLAPSKFTNSSSGLGRGQQGCPQLSSGGGGILFPECTSWDRKFFIGKFVVFLSAFVFLLGWRSENVHYDRRPEPGRDVQEGHKNGAGSHGTLQDLVKSIIRSDIKSYAIDSLFFYNFHLSFTRSVSLYLSFAVFYNIFLLVAVEM